uniref:Uncharacterized protein n=1 Tax=viral metagenome TaxID=1070528 RepID=A0A6C0ITA3_9ZZZZ
MDSKQFYKYLADKIFEISKEDYYGIKCETHCQRINNLLDELTNYTNNQSVSTIDNRILNQLKISIIEFIDIRNYEINPKNKK